MRVPHAVVPIILLCLGLVMPLSSRAEHTEPAPEPRKGEPEPTEEEHEGFDEESDYLALADAPLFLPRSYLYWGTPVGSKRARAELVFALEYALHLSIWNDVRQQALTGNRFAGAVTLSFEGDLRMLAVDSKPVRMPSYRPTLNAQIFHTWHRARPILLGLRVSIFHYSNGQEQCTFDEQLTDDSQACRDVTDAVRDAEVALNRRNGNFSTNGWSLALNTRTHQVNSKGVAIGHLAAGIGVSGMIRHGPGSMDAALARLYGWGSLNGTIEAKRRFGWATTSARAGVTYFPGTDGRTPKVAGHVELVLGPYWLTGLGFFARYYGGRDFYNAFFVDRVQQFAAGLAWDGERPLKFKRD